MTTKKEDKLICHSTLRRRGWTDSIVKLFKLVPDKTVNNPYYSCASDMKLYKLKRIERLEKTEKFQDALKKVEKRREGGRKAAERKVQKANERMNSITLYFPDESFGAIIKSAIDHYNDYHEEKGDDRYIILSKFREPTDEDIEFLQRIVLNYLRHCCTDYDSTLYDIKECRIGEWERYCLHDTLREYIEGEAIKKYPELELDKFGDWLREQGREAA